MIWFQAWTKTPPQINSNRYIFRNMLFVKEYDTKLFEIKDN